MAVSCLAACLEAPPGRADADPPADELARDDFAREVSNGWGDADVGGDWTLVGSVVEFEVTDQAGRISPQEPGDTSRARLDVLSDRTDLSVSLSLDELGAGGPVYFEIAGRVLLDNRSYSFNPKIRDSGEVHADLAIRETAGSRSLASDETTGIFYTPGDVLRVRVQAIGTSPTTVRGKIWREGTPEPGWLQEVTDSSTQLQAAGGVGVSVYLSTSLENAPRTATFDDLRATVPPEE